MPDREYIYEIILKARDETAAAFARATGNMEAYNALVEEQKRRSEEAKASQAEYVKEVENSTKSRDRLNKALQESKLRNSEAVRALRDYEQAQRRVNQAEAEGNRTNRTVALSDAANAHGRLVDALSEVTKGYNTMNRGAATVMANRLTEQANLQARLEQTAKQEEKEAKERERIEKDEAKRREAEAKERERIEREEARRREAEANDRLRTERKIADAINSVKESESREDRRRAKEANTFDAQTARERLSREKQVDAEISREEREAEARRKQLAREAEARRKELEQAEAARQRRIAQTVSGAAPHADILARTDVSQTQEIRATRALISARDQLVESGLKVEEAEKRIRAVRQQALSDRGFETQAARDDALIQRDKADAQREYEAIIKQVAQAEQARATARVASGTTTERRNVIRESLDLDVTRARAKLDEFRASERGRAVDVHVRVPDHDVALARAKLDVVRGGGGRGGGGGGGGGSVPLSDDPGGGGLSGAAAAIKNVQNAFSSLDTTTSGFAGHFRSALGFTIVTMLQPLTALIVGLVATMGALASAALAAATALGVTFVSGIAQGIPVIGLFAAAMQRLTQIFGYVQAVQQQVQQRFIAQYETQRQTAMGVNQVVIAQHNYSDALYAAQQAVINISSAEHSYRDALFSQQNAVYAVRVAQLGLLTVRRDAARQLQQLIFQETNARLAAQASTLAITNSQKSLAATIATGGDVQAAQLQLAQAHAQHTQAVTQAQQAVADAAPGSIARQNIQQTVEQGRQGVAQAVRAVADANFAVRQAQQGIVSAQRAVVDAQFQVAQARAAIIQAQQAAVGYNLATAAQLAWLRSQMTATERSLADNITRIYQMFQGVHGRLRPVTDAILAAFIPLTGQIIRVLNDPRIFGALLNLGQRMGDAIRQVTATVFSSQSLNNFVAIINAAADNLKPLATSISNIFRGVQAIIVTAIPYVHQFAGFLTGLTQQFAAWATSTRGQNWLKRFFDVAFQSLRAFINLGLAVVQLFFAIAGPGGGAHAGIGVIQSLTSWINRATASINSHGKVWKDLHRLWTTIGPTLKALGTILGAVVSGLFQLGTSRQGISSMQALANLFARVIVPAFVEFVIIIGRATNMLLNFLDKHPALEKFLVTLIAVGAAASIGFKAIGLIFGPLAQVLRIVAELASVLEPLGELLAAAFSGPAVFIAALVGSIVLLAAWTGKLQNLWNAVRAPFIAIWSQIQRPLQGLIRNFQYMTDSVGHLGGAFHVLRSIIGPVLDGIFRGIQHFASVVGSILGRAFGDLIKIVSNVFRLIGDILRGHWGAVFRDFANIGKAMVDGIWNALTALPRIIIAAFASMVRAVLRWLGIDSPSKVFIKIGKQILDGIWEGIKGIASFGKHILDAITGTFGDVFHWFEGVGGRIIDAIVKGIKSAPKKLLNAIEGLVPGPAKSVLKAAGSLLPWNWGQTGGPVGGPGAYGGGDRYPYRLEGGEHIFTKEEVRSAGGHSVILGLRRALGGGGQGGPTNYAVGGQVALPQSFTAIGLQNPAGQTTQGVTGLMGSVLANIQDFINQALKDWGSFWQRFNRITANNLDWEVKRWSDRFGDIFNNLKDSDNKLTDEITGYWGKIQDVVGRNLDTLSKNFKRTYKSFDTDTFNAFWYIWKAASQALTVFGAAAPRLQLASIPRFAEGGFIGQVGERGKDFVHAVLGRGEAVLNWAQQSFVDPAMKAYYGFGLDKLFQKVRGEHAGDSSGGYQGPMKARPNKFAAGGYVFPFPQNQSFSWARVDQGQDLQTTPGGVVLAIAPGSVRPASDRFSGFGGHYAEQAVTGGPLSGRGLYYGHIWATRFGNVNAGDVIGRTQTKANQWTAAPAGWLELGFLPYGSMSAGNAIAPILHALSAGHRISASMAGAAGAAATPAWSNIANIIVKGNGALKNTLQAAIGKVTDAANAFGAQQAGASGATPGGQVGQNWKGPWVSVMGQIAKKFNWSLPDWKWLVNAESSGNANAVNPSSGAFGLGQFLGATARAYAKFGALSHNPVKQIEAMGQYIFDRYKNPTVAKAFHLAHNWYREGGFVGGAKKIIGHVGEWVVNKGQQSRLANRLGTTVGALKDSMGFTGGPHSFQGGGVIGEHPTYSRTTGAYTDPASVVFDTPGFTSQAIGVYNAAQRVIASKIERNGRNLTKGIQTFLSNYDKVGGDNGLFALAAQAIQDYVNRQSSIVQLAAAGIRVVNDTLRSGRAQTAVQQAETDLRSTQAQITRELTLQREEVSALHAVQQQITRLGRPTRSNLATWQRLQGARQNLVNSINASDQTLAGAYSDQYQKQQALFTARITQTLRGAATLSVRSVGAITLGVDPGRSRELQASFNNLRRVLSKVGPTIALGLAQMAQSIAQTLQDPNKLAISDQEIIRVATTQHDALQRAYAQAAARAARDPRWQSTADDLLSQLESSVTSLVQAEAQALQDALQSQDIKQQLGNAALTMRDTIAQVLAASSNVAGPANQYAASAMQIQTSQARSGFIAQQIGAYQGLLGQAQAQGNTGVVNTLTQTIEQLISELAQANLQTQQLITANRQLAVTILNSQVQATNGFFQAAQGIAQTLGAIAGNQNLPALIQYAKDAGQALIQQGQQAVANIQKTLTPDASGATAFGANQGQASSFLDQLTAAFGQGPQAFADTLAQMGPQLASFEAGLPPDQQTLFQNLVQSLVDNTTAQVDNTQQLQQLNATTNQQQFTSSAWTMFREAIFNGLGGLLPQYAITVPSMDTGGILASSGLLYGHKDEGIVPAKVMRGEMSGNTYNNENHYHIDHPIEVADPVLLGNAVAWRLNHDPNSR